MGDRDKEIAIIQIKIGTLFTICAILTSVGIVIFYQNIEPSNCSILIGLISFIFGISLIMFFGYYGKQKINEV